MSEIDDFIKTNPIKREEKKPIIKNTEFNEDDKRKKIKEQLKGKKLRRNEKKMIKNGEYDSTTGRVREITISLSVLGIIIIILSREFLPNESLYLILIILGATSFLPVGMISGWLLFDPVMRCKVLRKVSRKNYGIINFVGHGNKAFPKIKNFDDSLIWKQNECWVMAKSRVYQITKDGNAINNGKTIDADSVLTYVDTVPVIFVDVYSMEPIPIQKEGRTAVYPEEIGSALKGWVDNQRAKMLAHKKMTDTIFMIVAAACIGALVVSIITMGRVEEMAEAMESMKNQLNTIMQNTKP